MVGRAGNIKSACVYSALCSNMLKLKWLIAETMCVVIAVMEKELFNRLPGINVSMNGQQKVALPEWHFTVWAVLHSIVSCPLFEKEKQNGWKKTEPNPETENERQRDKELNRE